MYNFRDTEYIFLINNKTKVILRFVNVVDIGRFISIILFLYESPICVNQLPLLILNIIKGGQIMLLINIVPSKYQRI